MIARVYINTGNLNIDRPFDYDVPPSLLGRVCIGARVKVPFGAGNRPHEALVTELSEKSSFDELKQIKSVSDDFPVLTKKAIELCFFMRESCFCTFYEAARLMMPPGSNVKFEEWISLEKGYDTIPLTPAQKKLVRLIEEYAGVAETAQINAALGKSAGRAVNALLKKGVLKRSYKNKRAANEKTVNVASYCGDCDIKAASDALLKSAPVQSKVLRFLAENGEAALTDIYGSVGTDKKAVDALCEKGLVRVRSVAVLRSAYEEKYARCEKEPHLTPQQKKAVEAVRETPCKTFLFHGVTGSGKTEVFIRLVKDCIQKGRQAIILVPEISLTPQMTKRFYERFGPTVALIHSALSLGERLDEWGRIKRGEAKLVIGARSAVFAPCENLGIIIIDEEHEQTYKSERVPRYHTRDVASFIAKRENIPLVLASATPSVESYYMAKTGKYVLLEMKERINGKALPKVEIADMRRELQEGNKTVLSRRLAFEIQKNIQNRQQTILFLNRRGYSTFVSCRDCGFVFMCPSCSVSLTYHKGEGALNCHLCGHSEKLPTVCPSCGSTRIKDFGKGTQKAQEQVEAIFPAAKVIRMDADTTSGKRGHEKLLERFSEDGCDILLGTQMVTKGLDFENVTLVGVLAADASLNADDYRAQERTFDLITQVCGRAGRGESPGRAVIQTYSPENKTLIMAAKQDYSAFYEEEISFRKEFWYPPFCDIISVTVSSKNEETAKNACAAAGMELRAALRAQKHFTYGPSKAPVYKLGGIYRWRVLIKTERVTKELLAQLRVIIHRKYGKIKSDLSVSADINPLSMN